ncbi:ATP-binding protein [Sunxiuqinia sp. A32]|uniref:ATP-binding protein n=1 Tax=Sunxiuqinia sp. A32 TaxID=3461496 RepID=UPI0040459B36
MKNQWEEHRNKIIGLGDRSAKKSYYPQLQNKIEELKLSIESFQSVLNNANDMIFVHDKKGEVLMINEQVYQSLQIPRNFATPLTIHELSSPKNDLSKLDDYWSEVLAGNPMVFEWITKKYQSDETIFVEVALNKTDWHGKEAIVAIVRDISDRKRYEEDLLAAKLHAEESDHLKSAFLANMSHEIRTPMNSILGFADLLKESTIEPVTQKRYLDIIMQSGDRLLGIINDLIDISIIEAGQINIKIKETDINQLLTDQVSAFSPEAKRKSISLITEIPNSSVPFRLNSDPIKLGQIITNLINNALKFTQSGSITVGYTFTSDKFIQFFVKDTGVGIPEELHEIIFDRFHKTDIVVDKIIEGTGLGLSISKAFIELLGGKIWVESTPEKGSCFYFTHPNNINSQS